MGLGCGSRCLKWVIFVFNVLFWLCGAAILGLGIWMAVDEEAFEILDITNPEGMDYTVWKITVYTMIGVGAFVFFIGFLGCVGACCENRCMLMTYSVLAGVALAGEITCAVLAVIYQDSIDDAVEAEMYDDLVNKYTFAGDPDNSYVVTWDNFQTKMACCGSYNFTDWHDNPTYSGPTGDMVPWTCCKMSEVSDPPERGDVIDDALCMSEGRTTNPEQQPNFKQLNNIGCHEALQQWVEEKGIIIFGVMLGLMVIQLLGMIFGFLLYCAVDDSDRISVI